MSSKLGALLKLGRLRCPGCGSTVTVYGETRERLDDGNPLRCPECKTELNAEAAKQLGWKR